MTVKVINLVDWFHFTEITNLSIFHSISGTHWTASIQNGANALYGNNSISCDIVFHEQNFHIRW